MKDKSNSKKNIILRVCAVIIAIILIFSFFLTVDFPADAKDLRLYRLSGVLLLATFEIGVLLEMDLFGLRKKIPLLSSTSIIKHISFWLITAFIACALFSIPYSMTSAHFKEQLNEKENIIQPDHTNGTKETITTPDATESKETIATPDPTEPNYGHEQNNTIDPTVGITEKEFLTWEHLSKEPDRYKLVLTLLGEHFNKRVYSDLHFSELSLNEKKLVEDLFGYANAENDLPTDFTETFTAFCVGKEFENMFLEAYDNPFYKALSNSFVISWKSDDTYYIRIKETSSEEEQDLDEFISEESPLTYVFDGSESVVGNCSIILRKIEIVNTTHKSYGGSSTYAKYIRIQATVKNNSSQEVYLTSKKNGQFSIGQYYGTNENTKIGWNDNYKWKVDSDIKADYGWTLKPNETREICVSGVFIDYDRLKYSDTPQIDLYFVSDGETLTLSVNKQ